MATGDQTVMPGPGCVPSSLRSVCVNFGEPYSHQSFSKRNGGQHREPGRFIPH